MQRRGRPLTQVVRAPMVALGTTLPPELNAKYRALCKHYQRSITAQTRLLIEYYVSLNQKDLP